MLGFVQGTNREVSTCLPNCVSQVGRYADPANLVEDKILA